MKKVLILYQEKDGKKLSHNFNIKQHQRRRIMKKQQVICIMSMVVFLALFSTSVYAVCTTTKCTGKIDRLYITGGKLYISTDGDERNLDCNAVSDVYLTLSTSNPDFKNYYAMMLTTMSMGNQIGLRIENGSQGCELLYAHMDN
jgi:hypothetical protein